MSSLDLLRRYLDVIDVLSEAPIPGAALTPSPATGMQPVAKPGTVAPAAGAAAATQDPMANAKMQAQQALDRQAQKKQIQDQIKQTQEQLMDLQKQLAKLS